MEQMMRKMLEDSIREHLSKMSFEEKMERLKAICLDSANDGGATKQPKTATTQRAPKPHKTLFGRRLKSGPIVERNVTYPALKEYATNVANPFNLSDFVTWAVAKYPGKWADRHNCHNSVLEMACRSHSTDGCYVNRPSPDLIHLISTEEAP